MALNYCNCFLKNLFFQLILNMMQGKIKHYINVGFQSVAQFTSSFVSLDQMRYTLLHTHIHFSQTQSTNSWIINKIVLIQLTDGLRFFWCFTSGGIKIYTYTCFLVFTECLKTLRVHFLLPLEKQCTDREHYINYNFTQHTQKVTVFSLKLTYAVG